MAKAKRSESEEAPAGPLRLRSRCPTGAGLPEIDVLWDPETGTLTGTGAAGLLAAAVDARRRGAAVYNPTGLYRETSEPLRDPVALAILFGTLGYQAPEALRPDLDAFVAALPPRDPLAPPF